MFVKHSFGVKYLSQNNSTARVSHPSIKIRTMTAVFAPQPPIFAPRSTQSPAHHEVHTLPLPKRQAAEVYRRRRLVALALLAGTLIGVLSFGRQADATPTPESLVEASVVITVQPGDTLWDIARSFDPDGDPRALVDELGHLVQSSTLQPGQQIVIPSRLLD